MKPRYKLILDVASKDSMGIYWLGSMLVQELTSGDFQLSSIIWLRMKTCQCSYGKVIIFIIITKWISKHGKVKENQMVFPHWTATESITIIIVVIVVKT